MTKIWTSGYEKVGVPDFIATLKAAKIKTLIDVREVANSRRAGFSKKALAASLDEAGIAYIHMKPLGTPKLGREAEGLDFPPYPGELGKRIFESVSKEAWQQWIRMQTMIINENRLNLADPRHRKYLAEQVKKHFFGEGADQVQGYVPPKS